MGFTVAITGPTGDIGRSVLRQLEAATNSDVKRFVYTSSVAAYGFHDDNPQPLTEEVPPKGTDEFYYSQQKAELERELWRMVGEGDVDTYVFRPCIVAGGDALMLIKA